MAKPENMILSPAEQMNIKKLAHPGEGSSTAPKQPAGSISKTINGKTYYQINGKVYDNPEGK
jgi:hypothetical protein